MNYSQSPRPTVMLSMMFRFIILFTVLPLFSIAQQLAIPDHGGVWVHDEAGVLSVGTKAELESILKAERDSTSNQIAVLVIPSLENDDMDGFALRVAEQWKLGKKDRDNGVLLLIAINDRKVRMEVGYGLEGRLTDALSSRINRNEIAPHFRQSDYDGGVKAGVIAIIQAIRGEYVNDDPPQLRRKSGKRSPLTTIIIIIIIIIFAARRNRRGGGGGGYWSSGGGFIGPIGGGFGSSSGSWGSGGSSDFGGGGGFGGGGSSDSW